MASTVRVDDHLHARLREISEAERRPIGQIIEDAIQEYERRRFWKSVNESVERLRSDPGSWQDYQDEVALFEGGGLDELVDEEPYYHPEEEDAIRAEHARTESR